MKKNKKPRLLPMMKAKVTVNRIGYSQRVIEVDLPAMAGLHAKFSDLTKDQQRVVTDIAENTALDQAGGESFSEHSSEYEIEDVQIIDENKGV